jgi:hypothetical protein
MSDALREFIEARVPREGLAAWGAQRADRTFVSQCYKNWLTSAQVEQTVSRLAVAAQKLERQDIEPLRLCSTFEHARVHLALRTDGLCLALLVENRPGLAQDALERSLDEFLALPAI